MQRYLVLAEGRSGDPHYGKTARGVVRYAREKVVAVLDSQRAGEDYEGFPIVGTVDDGLRFNPTTALVGVATAGGRFPPEWRQLLKSCVAAGLDIENGLHQRVSEDPELVELAREHGVGGVGGDGGEGDHHPRPPLEAARHQVHGDAGPGHGQAGGQAGRRL
jgi:uncharacterized NAD-dependent epimerase/dehydratase family protein